MIFHQLQVLVSHFFSNFISCQFSSLKMFIRANILIMNKMTRRFILMEKKIITQDLKTLWTNISISFSWDHNFSKFCVIIFSIEMRLLVILFNPPLSSNASWTTFLGSVFAVFSPVFVAVLNNLYRYLLHRFLANDKNPYPLMYILALGSIE